MAQITPTDLVKVIPTLIKKQSDINLQRAKVPTVPHIWGSPGIGKSKVVAAIAKMLGYELRDIRGALLDPVDLRGLPHLNGSERVHWAVPDFLPRPEDGKVLLFFDELNRAVSMVQNAILQLILDRQIGEYRLPPQVVCLAAGNYENDGGGVQRMNAALANRFIHFHLVASLKDWDSWALANDMTPEIRAFLKLRPDMLSNFSKDDYAYPTPRSWEFVHEMMSEGLSQELELAAIAGAVGMGTAVEFLAFIKLFRELPDMDYVINNPEKAPVPNGDVLYAVAAALAHRAEPSNFGNILRYVRRLPMEYMTMTVRDAAQRNPALGKTKEFIDWVVDHPEVFA